MNFTRMTPPAFDNVGVYIHLNAILIHFIWVKQIGTLKLDTK